MELALASQGSTIRLVCICLCLWISLCVKGSLAFVHQDCNNLLLTSTSSSTSTSTTRFEMSYRGGGGGGRGGYRGGGGGGGGRGRGRGEYYKNKYGGGGRGRGGGGGRDSGDGAASHESNGGGSYTELIRCLARLDGKSYGAYHDLDTPPTRGWVNEADGFTLFVERAQSDPFSPPTRCRVVVNAATAGIPAQLFGNRIRSMATADFLLRSLHAACKSFGADEALAGKGWGGPKGGDIQVMQPCQHVLEQTGVRIDKMGNVIAQVTINLPARGRTILGHAAEKILSQTLPAMIRQSLLFRSLPAAQVQEHVNSVEDQCWLQTQLKSKSLVAFVRNGAILPRLSGVDDRPMGAGTAVAFQSPQRLEVSFTLPNAGIEVTGMGIPTGITLICGGGFHGKSTLLQALEVGVYPKIPGDGREFCLTSRDAVKIRAEDGRNVQAVDISTFINNLPFGKDTSSFSTPDASGSTSQAANIAEAIEAGADTLLVDEDTCATNFMIRDEKMMQLVAKEKEPITPFVQIVRSMYYDKGISSVLVIGGVGDYFDVADNVVVMDSYMCVDATEKAKQIVANTPSKTSDAAVTFGPVQARRLVPATFGPGGKVKVMSQSSVLYGESELDLGCLEQLVCKSQVAAIANALQRIPDAASSSQTLRQVLENFDSALDTKGMDILAPGQFHGGMSRPRLFEFAGAINRLRRSTQSICQSK